MKERGRKGRKTKKIRTTRKRVRCWPLSGANTYVPAEFVVVESRTELSIIVPNRSPEEAV